MSLNLKVVSTVLLAVSVSYNHVWTPPVGSTPPQWNGLRFCSQLWDGSWNNAFMVCVLWSKLNGERLCWLWTISQCVFMCVRVYVGGYTGFPGSIQRSFFKCWPTVGMVVMVSSFLLRQWPLFSFSVITAGLQAAGLFLLLSFSASQICFVGLRRWKDSNNFRMLVFYKILSVYTTLFPISTFESLNSDNDISAD